ncbi:MAG: MarR family transcriptional regulator [Lachnospiraceae bacterium]|jgi:DNA-binding MarR family transcriptional regulator|nr:MarR family transcriptional regulator [Lachnospiraceae bacterium]GFI03560.1 organic hydroperoxide resistance transcriptional regulator [Lachnospiraceae bacterium]
MKLNDQGISQETFQMIKDYIEEVKELLSSDIWENIFLDCSKNEVLIFWLLYQRREVNMTEIAEYIHVPLNTATGIINRMENNELIVRTRSQEDKRVVLIGFSERGMAQFQNLVNEMMYYGLKIMSSFTKEEMDLFYKMMTKVKEILRQEKKKEETPKKIRKITIE